MGFHSLQHSRAWRSTHHGFATPAKFRPQGLATLSTAYSLRARAGFVSHRRRSWDSPFGAFPSHKVSVRFRTEGPTYRFTRRCSRRRSGGPAQQASVSGLQPSRESLAACTGLAHEPLAAPLGFRPSRANQQKPWSRFRPTSSHALPETAEAAPAAPQSLNRLLPGPTRRLQQATAKGRNDPSRVSAPAQSRIRRRRASRAMDSPQAASYIAAD
jgi:hypothetical protein